MDDSTKSLRSEIDALREQLAAAKVAASLAEAEATAEWRNARLVAERDALQAELASMGLTPPVAPPAPPAPPAPAEVPAVEPAPAEDDPRAGKR